MADLSLPTPARAPLAATLRGAFGAHRLALVTTMAIVMGVAVRLLDARLPFWLDEVWTAAIVSRPDLGTLLHHILLDANAPLYFVLMHAWTQVFGLSEVALRVPSFVFSALAPLVALIPVAGLRRETRCVWAMLLALWVPAIWYAEEARCYSLALLLGTAGTLAYVRLLQEPTRRRAMLWALLAALSLLIHYYAALLILAQGLGFLWLHRLRALRCWPAALVFVPALAWCALHIPRILRLGGVNAWQSPLGLDDLPSILGFLLGDAAIAAALAALGAFVWRQFNPGGHPQRSDGAVASRPALVAVGAAVAGVLLVVTMGVLTPSFVDRYLLSFAPGILLGVALGVSWATQRGILSPVGMGLGLMASALAWSLGVRATDFKAYNYDAASQFLMQAGVGNLVFLLDSRQAMVVDQGQLGEVGAFYFRRAGRPVTVRTLQLAPDEDPNPRIEAATANRPHAGVIWVYDLGVRGTAALRHPPRLAALDPAWRCRHYGLAYRFNVHACYRDLRQKP